MFKSALEILEVETAYTMPAARDKWTVEPKREYINGDFRVNHLLRRAA